jgi:hypothetical protein
MIKKTAFAAAALALSVTAAPATAADWSLIDWNGQQVWGAEWTPTTTLSWGVDGLDVWYRVYFDGYSSDYMNGNQPLPGLASTVLYKLTDVSANKKSWTFDYVVENASADPVEESRVSAIGFDVINPDPTQVILASGGEYNKVGGDYLSGSTGEFDAVDDRFDVCFTSKSGSMDGCNPGSNAGPELGESGSGSFTLKFSSGRNAVSFFNPVVAYGGIEYDIATPQKSRYGSFYSHYHSKGCGHDKDDGGWGTPSIYVPEPATWAMMVLGFGAAGAMVRTRRRLVA